MALIKCLECGHEISDKASTCPNCGCPIEKGLVCNECGTSLSSEDTICPNCGNPIKDETEVSEIVSPKEETVVFKESSDKPQRHTWKVVCGIVVLVALVLGGFYYYKNSQEKARLEYEAMQKAKADSARVADMAARAAAAEQARLDSIKAVEEERRLEEEKREREYKAIVGTYYFTAHRTDYVDVDMYDGHTWWKEEKMLGYTEWTDYLVVMEDRRVSLLSTSSRRFVGTINDVNNGVFVISINSRDNATVGAWSTSYRNGKDIGRLGDKGFGFPNDVVIDTNTRRVYNGVGDYNNRDISDVIYTMYDRHSSVIEESNNTNVNKVILNKKYER